MKPKKFQIIHPAYWAVLKVLQFDMALGSCHSTGTILYERPYREGEYTKDNSDEVDLTIKKGLSNLFGKVECCAYNIQIEGERDDYITLYSQSKRTASLTIRCMPQVLITPQTADLEEQIVGFDFDFKIYFDCLDEGFQIPSFLTISSYDPKNQTVFEKSSQVLKEL